MARIEWNDLEETRNLTADEMSEARGGWYYFNVFNRFYNPYGWALQNSWIHQSRTFDLQHNNFINFLRS